MPDLSDTIIAKSDQLNADDLMGGAITVKVTNVTKSTVDGQSMFSVHYEGDNNKPFKPCKTMRRVMVAIWGKDGNLYKGKFMTLYRDPDVKYAGEMVGGIRISHMSNLDKPKRLVLTATNKSKKPVVIQPLAQQKPTASPEPEPEPEQPQIDTESLIKTGDQVVQTGYTTYTQWTGSLTPEERAAIKHKHQEWKKTAIEADSDNDEAML